MSDKRTISIYPNTIGFGYVVLNYKGEILDYGMVSIRPVDNDKCLKRIKQIVSYYQPKELILQDYLKSNKSERIKKLLKRIYNEFQENFKISHYSKEEVKNTFDVFGAKNKYEISKKIVEVYPEFESKLPEKRKVWEPENYYQGIFDALSLILTHYYLK